MLDQLSAPRPLVLPPPFTPHWLTSGDTLAEACRLAPDEGAGFLVWHHGTQPGQAGRFDFAVVLEPETPLAEARNAFVVGMVALGDALATHCPPEREVRFGWPGEVILDKGRIGGMRLAVAPDTAEDAVPAWMALGVELIADRDCLTMPGDHPGSVSLKEEEFADPAAILESFASHLMLNFDRSTHQGFAVVAKRYSARLSPKAVLTESMALVRDGKETPLIDGLSDPYWREADGPRL